MTDKATIETGLFPDTVPVSTVSDFCFSVGTALDIYG